MGINTSTYTNFAVRELRINPENYGFVESIREVPGFLAAFIAGLTMRIAEPSLAGMAIGLVAMGVGSYYYAHSIPSLIIFSFLWSLGLHCWMPLSSSMVLSLSKKEHQGRRLGAIGGVAALATCLGMGLVYFGAEKLGYRNMFPIAGFAIAMGAISVLFISRDIGNLEKPRFVLRRKYKIYYFLNFLEGCRKQVFITFAIFALVKVYKTRIETVALLMVANNLMNLYVAPRVGKLIDMVGERKVLTFNYIGLIFIFLGYALIHKASVLYVCYCLDSLFFAFSMSITTYLNKIAPPSDVMPSLAMGVTFNHIAAVMVPTLGGILWKTFGYEKTFMAGAIVVFISLLAAQKIRTD